MRIRTILPIVSLSILVAACSAVDGHAIASDAEPTASSSAALRGAGLEPVASANPKSTGRSAANALSRGLVEAILAQGATPVENPAHVWTGSFTAWIPTYGYFDDGPFLPTWGDIGSETHHLEATKSEPDKNTYLVLDGVKGADSYDYGHHFLFQGHEAGPAGYVTRTNLDADAKHRVTIVASTDVNGLPLPSFDGSTWDPFAARLLFTSENGAAGGA